jgi:plastocyanin
MMAKIASFPPVLSVVTTVTILSIFLMSFGIIDQSFATIQTDTNAGTDQVPNINASSVFDTHQMVLGNNFKNLVILIPNEGHESQNIGDESADQRLINQPYIPQSATVPKGTTVTWFNGDVDHDHKITLTGQNNNPAFDSDVFVYNTASQPVVMNNTGTFGYFEADVNNEDTDYVMNGTINVVDQPENPNSSTSAGNTGNQSSANIDTVGILMVPTEDLATYTSDLENGGLSVLSTHNFNDIRGGDPQTLISWGTSSGTNSIENVISQLEGITSTLPYS